MHCAFLVLGVRVVVDSFDATGTIWFSAQALVLWHPIVCLLKKKKKDALWARELGQLVRYLQQDHKNLNLDT